ncbi:hypothetical protein F1559_004080 [Cyanidiococcus yangmingshanensis]|uniref:Uncharacterized protein n=1 Tax=Cyanidiococcus yangmingshanensis TaxID=2690220 RepID=A0A7J7IJ60_9RHOD|nr:hypothetical protein F1559_004080 [Cyanidiococcus yangmingshanensis]
MSAFPSISRLYFLRLVATLALLALFRSALRLGTDWKSLGKPRFPLTISPPFRRPQLNQANRCFLSISSDDWGRWTDAVPIFPNRTFAEEHEELQTAPRGFWYRFATSETLDDLQTLRELLRHLNQDVAFEKRVVLTPHWIVGGPDFLEMSRIQRPFPHDCRRVEDQRSERCGYRELLLHNSAGGLSRAPYFRGDLREMYRQLYIDELWHPEYHGRSHFSISRWLEELNIPGSKAALCFNHSIVCGTSQLELRSEFDWFNEHHDLVAWIQGGVDAFRAFWGYLPRILSSPHNTWTPWLADAVRMAGFIGTSLGDVQDVYRMDGGLVVTNRPRFDAFYPNFDCQAATRDIVHLLNSTKYANVMWHAQNAMKSAYSSEDYEQHLSCFERLILKAREALPNLAIVTESELHQIRARGWSAEIWNNSIIYRNYLSRSVDLVVADCTAFGASNSWEGRDLVLEKIQGTAESHSSGPSLRIGDKLRLHPDSIIRIQTIETKYPVQE